MVMSDFNSTSSGKSPLHAQEQPPKYYNKGEDESYALSVFTDLCIVSPPLKNNKIIKNTTLTPPPNSEVINRAIRTAEHNLDKAVETVQRYISEGCPDSDSIDKCRVLVGSPESDYSNDLSSPKVLPDFNSPLNSGTQEFDSDYGSIKFPSDRENYDPNSTGKTTMNFNSLKNNISSHDDSSADNKTAYLHNRPILHPASPMVYDEECIVTGMKGRTLLFNGKIFQVWPPLNNTESGVVGD